MASTMTVTAEQARLDAHQATVAAYQWMKAAAVEFGYVSEEATAARRAYVQCDRAEGVASRRYALVRQQERDAQYAR